MVTGQEQLATPEQLAAVCTRAHTKSANRTKLKRRIAWQPEAPAALAQMSEIQLTQFGPINSRSVSGVAHGAAPAKRFIQSVPAPIFTRSGVNSGDSAFAISA